jgi:hypothetical protein
MLKKSWADIEDEEDLKNSKPKSNVYKKIVYNNGKWKKTQNLVKETRE